MRKNYNEFNIEINDNKVKVDVSLLHTDRYECQFSEKEIITALGAKGFTVTKTMVGIKEVHFIAILLNGKTKLTIEMMQEIWNQIPQEDLPK